VIGVFVLVAAVVIFAVAAAVIGREARRLDARPSEGVVDLDAAVQWVARHLPFEVSAVLSYDDVRRILDWHLEFLRSRSMSSNGHGPHDGGQVVVGGAETAEYVLMRSESEGSGYTPAQVHAVLEAQMAYLETTGAVGPVEGTDGGT